MSEPARVPIWALVVTPMAMLASFLLGLLFARPPALPEPQGTALRLVHREILASYVDEVDGTKLLDRAIAAMAALDDYSEYVPPSDVATFVEDTTGTYDGIGMLPHVATDGLFVRVAVADGPADRAGLEPGDRILAIDGVTIDDLGPDERLRIGHDRLRGPSGSKVTLLVQRGDGQRTIVVERGPVQKSSVKWAQFLAADEGLAYVHLADFHPGCSKGIERALADLAAAPSGLRGLVLDLRFDGGGNLDECLALARLFLAKGNIVTLRRRGTEVVESHDATGQCPYPTLPLVLLVNGSSASASEVLAGALQDHSRAAIVGTETYGKGYVNTVFQWKDLDFRLKLTTATYFTPNGRNLERDRRRRSSGARGDAVLPPGGITPDRVVALDDKVEAVVRAALADTPFAEHHRTVLTAWSKTRGLRLPGNLPSAEDPQLAAAVATLRERLPHGDADTSHGK